MNITSIASGITTLWRTYNGALLVRYAIVGVASIAIQVGFLFVWVSVLGFTQWYLIGAVLGFIIALIVAFLCQKYWTFRDMEKETRRRQFVLYSAIACANLLLTVGLLAIAKFIFESQGADFFALWYVAAQTVILGLGAVLGFLANRFVTFKALLKK